MLNKNTPIISDFKNELDWNLCVRIMLKRRKCKWDFTVDKQCIKRTKHSEWHCLPLMNLLANKHYEESILIAQHKNWGLIEMPILVYPLYQYIFITFIYCVYKWVLHSLVGSIANWFNVLTPWEHQSESRILYYYCHYLCVLYL